MAANVDDAVVHGLEGGLGGGRHCKMVSLSTYRFSDSAYVDATHNHLRGVALSAQSEMKKYPRNDQSPSSIAIKGIWAFCGSHRRRGSALEVCCSSSPSSVGNWSLDDSSHLHVRSPSPSYSPRYAWASGSIGSCSACACAQRERQCRPGTAAIR